jgi:hydroxypyruvate isomerase
MNPLGSESESRLNRRDLLRSAAATAATAAALGPATSAATPPPGRAGRIKQSACRWCYNSIPLDDLCVAARNMGLVGIDLLGPKDFETLKKHGLVCTMVSSHPLANGLCDPTFHEACLRAMNDAIEATAKEGWKNVICFSGNARGIDRDTGLKNCVKALKEIVPVAEKAGVILQMELLNSKVNHKDYMCDHSAWGVELVQRVGSDNFKLLYDIYHMQIMEGDIIRTIRDNIQYIGHFHTAGNPGRNEFDETQELYYPPICKAIADLNFQGYLAHEYTPTKEPLETLDKMMRLCEV